MLVLILTFKWDFSPNLCSCKFEILIFIFLRLFWLKFWHDTLLTVKWPRWPLNDLLRSLNTLKCQAPKFHSKLSQKFKNQFFRFLTQKMAKFKPVWGPKNQIFNFVMTNAYLSSLNFSRNVWHKSTLYL